MRHDGGVQIMDMDMKFVERICHNSRQSRPWNAKPPGSWREYPQLLQTKFEIIRIPTQYHNVLSYLMPESRNIC
jgi:hypothetical protein